MQVFQSAKSTLQSLIQKGAFYIFVGSFLSKAAAFLGSVVLVRVMLVEEYGVLAYMENLYNYAYIFAGYGLNNALGRYAVLKDSMEEKRGVFDYVISKGTLFNIVFVLVLSIIAIIAPHHEEFSVAAVLLPMMLLSVPLQFMYESGTFMLRALFKNKPFAIFGVVCICSVYIFKATGASLFGITGATLSWPLTYALMAFAITLFIRKSYFKHCQAKPVSCKERKEMTVYSLQYMVTNGLWAIFMQNDILLLGMLSGNPSSVAIYKVAYVIPAAINLFSTSIGIFVAPYFVKNENDQNWVWRNYKKVLFISVVVMGTVAGFVAIAAEPLILLLYGESYISAVDVMRILAIVAFVNNAIRYTAANLLAAMGHVRINLVVAVVGIAVQVVMNILLIPRLGMYGAAFSSTIVYMIMAVIVTLAFVTLYKPKKS